MAHVVVFNILIPCTENATGIVHPPSKFEAWVLDTGSASRSTDCGSIPTSPDELREYARDTARNFGQKCLYFERAGEAEFVWDPAFDPELVG